MSLRDFKVLSFDCYGTLIDWETGIWNALQPLLARSGELIPREVALETFGRIELDQETETPGMLYSDLLAVVHRRMAAEWSIPTDEEADRRFGGSVSSWPAFPDSAAALQYLKKFYKLVVLSNVDHKSFSGSNKHLAVEFDAVYTAQDIGSYKPSLANFRYLIRHLAEDGFSKSKVLHVAQSLLHDHVPANEIGIRSAWIDRRHDQHGMGATVAPRNTPAFDFRFTSMAELVRAHQDELLLLGGGDEVCAG